jgi:uncharacterized protein (DUF433 family)
MVKLDRQKKPAGLGGERMCFGRYIVADPKVCHGKITFAGTRIFVADVLEMVAKGMDWNAIVKEWRGRISQEAIGEAVRLGARAFLDHAHEYALESGGGAAQE